MQALPRTIAVSLVSVVLAGCGQDPREALPENWPPKVGEPYPDLDLRNDKGEWVKLSAFKGKVLLIEPIGMPCKACVAFCGGEERGPFQGTPPQADLPSLDELLPRFASGIRADDDRLVVVQLLLFGKEMGTPTPEDARAWIDHFGLADKKNHVVLVGTDALREGSRHMIPGYQLVDRDFVLHRDGGGNGAPHNLYNELFPAVPGLLDWSGASPR